MLSERPKQPAVAHIGDAGSPTLYFGAVYNAFEQAGRTAGGIIDRFYTIAGYTVRLRFAGPALLPLITPALAHLAASPSSAPDLTVCLWDSETTGVQLPFPPWRIRDRSARGEVPGYSDGRFYTAFQPRAGILSMLDASANRAVFWIPRAAALPSFEMAMPLRAVFHWWMSGRGRQLIHAAAVGTADGGVLLVGRGGVGKSTTALACLSAAMAYAGDDYIAFQMEPTPIAHSLYSSGKLAPDALARLPHLLPAISTPGRPGEEKAVLFLHEHYPQQIRPSLPIRAVLLPRVTDRLETTIVRTSAGAALIALAPSTIFWLPHAGERALQAMAALLQRVPSYVLYVGTDLAQVPAVIADLLKGLGSSSRATGPGVIRKPV